MVNKIKSFIYKYIKKREKGDGGIIYAMCFICLITCIILYAFLQFHASMRLMAQTVEMKLHIIESQVVAFSHAKKDATGEFLEDDYETELSRMHIIRHVTPKPSNIGRVSGGTGSKKAEYDEITNIGRCISEEFKYELGLGNDGIPTSGSLYEMTGGKPNMKVLLRGYREDPSIGAIIYEPAYKITVTEKTEGGKFTGYYDIHYDITGWYIYKLYFNSTTNEYMYANKEYKSGGIKLHNGRKLTNVAGESGATIEMFAAVPIWAPRNIFSKNFGGSEGPDAKDWGYVEGVNSWTKERALVCTEAMDIVPAILDDRQKPH